MAVQYQRYFFGGRDNKAGPSESEKLEAVSRDNPKSPFSRFIGNDKAVRKLQTAAYVALGHPNHEMRDLAFSVFGPSSSGKTTLVRLYAETVELPYVEVSPKQIKSLDDLFKEFSRVLSEANFPLVEVKPSHYTIPPTVVLIDEVHALSNNVVQGLLKATEYNDGIMATETGKIVNTQHITWFIATTDEGKLFDAFRTRFSPLVLQLLNKREVSRIVKLAHPELSQEVCDTVAHYNSRVPRKALEFARYMKMFKLMYRHLSWDAVAKQVALDEGIDEYGMHEVHLKILRALGQGPIARNRISLVAGRKEEEVEKFILPWLLVATDDQPALVNVKSKGYTITEAGLTELDKRGILHLGKKASG